MRESAGPARPRQIAIDGPVAVGKSTVGRLLAKRLGYRFVDTGSMYRALTWKALQKGVSLEDEEGLVGLATSTRFQLGRSGDNSLLMDGRVIGGETRAAQVEKTVSVVSKVAEVRQALVAQQRRMASRGGVVMAGRDIGTVVLPRAGLKIFLEASPPERAHRRHREISSPGKKADYQAVFSELERRDEMDSHRAVSPLKPAADAHIIDTEGLTPEGVVETICRLMEGR